MADLWTCPETNRTFKTGLQPTPKHKLLAMPPHVVLAPPPAQVSRVPKYRSMFDNDRDGDCVTAESAFAKTCENPEIIIPDSEVIRWCRQHGVLNGADLGSVSDWMAEEGFKVGSQLYNEGPRSGVDYTNDTVLQSAIAQGPVKIAIAASALPGGAGSRDGFYATTSRDHRTDHCVSLCGYGTAGFIFEMLKVPLPSALSQDLFGYMLYTWSTIGFVAPAWVKGTTDEAMVRNPTTIGVPPLAPPTPPVPPGPSPLPTIQGVLTVANGNLTVPTNLVDGNYVIFPMTKV